ncbi:hypothetical protein QQ045_023999 [Rhodiola kirilowii]
MAMWDGGALAPSLRISLTQAISVKATLRLSINGTKNVHIPITYAFFPEAVSNLMSVLTPIKNRNRTQAKRDTTAAVTSIFQAPAAREGILPAICNFAHQQENPETIKR